VTATPPAPIVTARLGSDPCPRVDVTVSPMPPDAAAVTVWRAWPGDRQLVRGAVRVPATGDTAVTDYEPPLGVPVVYTCQTVDAAGVSSAVSQPSAPVVLDVPDAWLQSPTEPGSAIALALRRRPGAPTLKLGSLGPVTYASDLSVVAVPGQPLPIALGTARRQASAVPLAVHAGAFASDALRDLLMGSLMLCLRVPAGRARHLPPVAYVALESVTEDYRPPPLDRSVWAISATLVRGPGYGVLVPARTYDQLAGEAPDYAGLAARFATYLAAQRGS